MDEQTIFINDQLQIPTSELRYRTSRSSGPGGQHVNRSETRVELVWDVRQSPSLNVDQRRRLLDALHNRIDKEGVLHLTSAESRSQERNRAAVTTRFADMVRAALKPQKERKKLRISRAAKQRRLKEKRWRSEKKRLRAPVREDE